MTRSRVGHGVGNFFGEKQFGGAHNDWTSGKRGDAIGIGILGALMAVVDASSIVDGGASALGSKISTKAVEVIAENATNLGDRYLSGYTTRQLESVGEDRDTIERVLAKEGGVRKAPKSFLVERTNFDSSSPFFTRERLEQQQSQFIDKYQNLYSNPKMYSDTEYGKKLSDISSQLQDEIDAQRQALKGTGKIKTPTGNSPAEMERIEKENQILYRQRWKARVKALYNIHRRVESTIKVLGYGIRGLQLAVVATDIGISVKETFSSPSPTTTGSSSSPPAPPSSGVASYSVGISGT
jgi:hypothetical protein